MFGWFKKNKISRKSLQNKTTKTLKKEWEKRLKEFVKHAQAAADRGATQIHFSQAHINVQYNRTRSREAIFNDMKKAFPDCNLTVVADPINGQESVTISW